MMEGLIADLVQINSLKVISGSSGSMAQGAGRSLAEVGRELGVQAIVKGSIRRARDSV
jgi:TolB-like protein